MYKRFALAAAILMNAALMVRAAESCPWLNAATAAGVLGGDVTLRVTRADPDKDDGACTFELRRGQVSSRLAVSVTTMRTPRAEYPSYVAQCRQGTPLKAIGNEALACEGADHAERWVRVLGRVRDHAFVVRISTSDASAPGDVLREKARRTAEQVAGVLF